MGNKTYYIPSHERIMDGIILAYISIIALFVFFESVVSILLLLILMVGFTLYGLEIQSDERRFVGRIGVVGYFTILLIIMVA